MCELRFTLPKSCKISAVQGINLTLGLAPRRAHKTGGARITSLRTYLMHDTSLSVSVARAFKRRFTIHTAQHSHVNTLEAPNVRSVGAHDMSAIQQSADDQRIHHLKLEPCTASIAPKDSVRNWAVCTEGSSGLVYCISIQTLIVLYEAAKGVCIKSQFAGAQQDHHHSTTRRRQRQTVANATESCTRSFQVSS